MIIYSNVWGAARAKQIVSLKKPNIPLLIIAPNQHHAELLRNELLLFSNSHCPVLVYPEYMHAPFEEVRINTDIATQRTITLKNILEYQDNIVVTTPYATLKKIAPAEEFKKSIINIKKGNKLPQKTLFELFDSIGYIPVEVVTGPGEYCVRGGIVDVFPLGNEFPVRIEYFDDEIDSLFTYNAQTQKRIKEIDNIILLPASEVLLSTQALLNINLPDIIHEKIENFGKYAGHHWLIPVVYPNSCTLFDYLPPNHEIIVLEEHWQEPFERTLMTVQDRMVDSSLENPMEAFLSPAEIKKLMTTNELTLITDVAVTEDTVACRYRSVKSRFAFEKSNLYQSMSSTIREIKSLHSDDMKTIAAMESERFITLLEDFCRDYELPLITVGSVAEVQSSGILYLYKQRMSGGFIDEVNKLVCVTDEEIFGFVRKRTKTKPKESFSTAISDLEVEDYVVHVDYGIGVYKGLRHMVIGGLEGDYLEITYDNNEKLYVPLEQISQIQKYIGIGDSKPRISSLQSTNWSKLKTSARGHAAKIAQDLLKLYAERKSRKGFSFTGNDRSLQEFEESFPYDETEDQLSAILDVYKDMENNTPMERLVCGDVGFGKTEVAMRAACKAVFGGKQVAILVPTTVLARQHYLTFIERFTNTAVQIDFMSRFRTSEEIRKIKTKLEAGEIDIIIGTHRLLSSDIRFKDLGLLVIDEEQRFGVAHKEKISAMRSNIDVLSLSATPIPRTLQLSLSGIRDISVIETPPENRSSIAVKVIRKGEEVKRAITNELERGGQIFFLHNRIKDIESPSREISQAVPHARIAIAHGQTSSKELESILKQFYNGEIDVLVSTTIIENGIDIPNVNAIIIDNAENFGLSQLYQLKGRVGRGERRGYCYLLVNDFSSLTPVAKKRLSIIQQLSELGSGIKIAMYDLQLRGAGDILGAQQSGFVVKVGYELFLKMISEAVAELQQVSTVANDTEIITQYPHYISAEYIEDPRIRLDYYRTFAMLKDRDELFALFDELTAQYGELKTETSNLGHIMLVKNLSISLGIIKAGIYPKMITLTFSTAAQINPTILTNVATKLDLKFRFSGEYEIVLAFQNEDNTLTSGLKFLEMISSKLQNI